MKTELRWLIFFVFLMLVVATTYVLLSMPVTCDPKAEYSLMIGSKKISRDWSGTVKVPISEWKTVRGNFIGDPDVNVVNVKWNRKAPCIFSIKTPILATWVDGRFRDVDHFVLPEGKSEIKTYKIEGDRYKVFSRHRIVIQSPFPN